MEKQIGKLKNMIYDEDLDEWICANKKRLIFSYERKRKTDNGYESVSEPISVLNVMVVRSNLLLQRKKEKH